MRKHDGRKKSDEQKAVAPVRRLQCCCCGESAGRWQQWSNRDDGYGVCLRCVTWFRQDERETEDEIKNLYGVEGVNWGARITIHGRTFRALACFAEAPDGQQRANAWMLKNPTHALLATRDGYYWLADVNDKGGKDTTTDEVKS